MTNSGLKYFRFTEPYKASKENILGWNKELMHIGLLVDQNCAVVCIMSMLIGSYSLSFLEWD